ncbi:unnamed protein product [Darwinula stevensoni]|uniref:Uncharacterized protein n=1 Tax=Darwinula stevensoni TaxID=69355 RepID=A0A7R9A3W4_9CRUS|nr:unnamed protein product [Darwinula stevensoni]CAG0888806.1 unnamed protein product [Darwinula stevensoni]
MAILPEVQNMKMVIGLLAFQALFCGCLISASTSQDCGGVLTEPHGEIQSPGYPDSYPPNIHCRWVVQVPSAGKIILTFNDIELGNHQNCVSGDHLTISDPEGDSKITCDPDVPNAIESIGNTLYIDFTSDADGESGFRFRLTYVAQAACEEGWQQFGSHCYFFSDEVMHFDNAQADCEARDAQLASIHSKEEQMFVQERVKTSPCWIGATNPGYLTEDPFNFEFIDGTGNDYHNIWQWDGYHPFNCVAGCGILLVPDRWANRDCLEIRQVICDSMMSHGQDWRCWTDPMPDLCFHVSTEFFTFDEARAYCLQFPRADILAIRNDEFKHMSLARTFEVAFQIPRAINGEFWIGLIQDASGVWQWVDGSPIDVDRWEEGNPTEAGGECGVITSSWDDLEREYSASYVCKKSS